MFWHLESGYLILKLRLKNLNLQFKRWQVPQDTLLVHWKWFHEWSALHHIDPIQCSVSKALAFLQRLLDGGKCPSTLKDYVAVNAAHHMTMDEVSLCGKVVVVCMHTRSSPDVKQRPWQLKGVHRTTVKCLSSIINPVQWNCFIDIWWQFMWYHITTVCWPQKWGRFIFIRLSICYYCCYSITELHNVIGQ